MRTLLVLCLVTSAGCTRLHRYAIGPVDGRPDLFGEVARSLVAAGEDVVDTNATTGIIKTRWVKPFGQTSPFERRFVVMVDAGKVTLRLDAQWCETPAQTCTPADEGHSEDLEALEALASRLGQELKAPVQVLQN